MISRFEVWRRTLWRWAAPLAFCVVNLVVLWIYFQFYSGRVERLSDELTQTQGYLENYRTELAENKAFLASLEEQEKQVGSLYKDHFQTESERFTAAIREVKRLAREAGLKPSNLSYPYSGKAAYGLSGRDINFSVDGTYRQVRTFINFLELSDHFLTLREVGLTGTSEGNRREPTLGIQLKVTTYFHSNPEIAEEEPVSADAAGTVSTETVSETAGAAS